MTSTGSDHVELPWLLNELRRRLAGPQPWWDPAVRETAHVVATRLSDLLGEMQARDRVANAVLCDHAHCRYLVTFVRGISEHLDSTGQLLGQDMELPIVADDGSVTFVRHKATPADQRRQAELREIVEGAVGCARCDYKVATVDGSTQHIDDNGKLLGKTLAIYNPDLDATNSQAWERHDATPVTAPEGTAMSRGDR
jgi:hypothetical protein